jgi:hypothetical protein
MKIKILALSLILPVVALIAPRVVSARQSRVIELVAKEGGAKIGTIYVNDQNLLASLRVTPTPSSSLPKLFTRSTTKIEPIVFKAMMSYRPALAERPVKSLNHRRKSPAGRRLNLS